MKRFFLGFATALVLVAVIYTAFTFLPGFLPKKKGPLFDNDVKKATEAVLCDNEQHVCNYFDKTQNSGNLRVILAMQTGDPVQAVEVDVADMPGASKYYVKYTDNAGVALFTGIPAGSYQIYFNGVNFPKIYIPDTPTVPVTISKDKTEERKIELHPR